MPGRLGSEAGEPRWEERFEALTGWLVAHRPIWEHRTFIAQPAPWEAEHGALAGWLRRLSEDEIEALEATPYPALASAPEPLATWIREAGELVEVPDLSAPTPASLGRPRLPAHVPGRKWRQVEAFVSAVLATQPDGVHRWVDWCAGKGHLGRTLSAVTLRPVTLVERDEALCRTGARLADRLGARYRYLRADALEESALEPLGAGVAAVALHACGALTDALLAAAVTREVTFVATALCCYHHVGDSARYAPRSVAGRTRDLRLTVPLLRFPIYDEVVARPRERALRRREMAFRAGYDLLVREATGEDRYATPGRLRAATVRLGFGRFCEVAARQAGQPLPGRWDPDTWERRGRERSRVARALGLVRAVFRRPVELWLVLDRLLALTEANRSAQLGTFCTPGITPRNLFLVSGLEG